MNEKTVKIKHHSEVRSWFVAGTDYLKFTDDPDFIDLTNLLKLNQSDDTHTLKRIRVTKLRFSNNQGIILEFPLKPDQLVLEIDPDKQSIHQKVLQDLSDGVAFLPKTCETVAITAMMDVAFAYSHKTGLMMVTTTGPDVLGRTYGENSFLIDKTLLDYEPGFGLNGFLLSVDVTQVQP